MQFKVKDRRRFPFTSHNNVRYVIYQVSIPTSPLSQSCWFLIYHVKSRAKGNISQRYHCT